MYGKNKNKKCDKINKNMEKLKEDCTLDIERNNVQITEETDTLTQEQINEFMPFMDYDVEKEFERMREEAKEMPEYKELTFKIGDSVYATLHKEEYPLICGENEQITIKAVVDDIIKVYNFNFEPLLVVNVNSDRGVYKINNWREDIILVS